MNNRTIVKSNMASVDRTSYQRGVLPTASYPKGDRRGCRISFILGNTNLSFMTMSIETAPGPSAVPPGFTSDGDFGRWRESKLSLHPLRAESLWVEVANPHRPTAAEVSAIRERCRQFNMALYASHQPIADGARLREFGRHIGLHALDPNPFAGNDGVAHIQVASEAIAGEYIPYTTRGIRWHTDGYYNKTERQIRGLIMHCVAPAQAGGINRLLDPDILFAQLWDLDPKHVRALMQPDALTIPENAGPGPAQRPARTGPVFSIVEGRRLHMRYTARTRSVRWLDDPQIDAARGALEALITEISTEAIQIRLEANQGLVCNNVLHDRSAFDDDGGARLMLRARYLQRVPAPD